MSILDASLLASGEGLGEGLEMGIGVQSGMYDAV